MQIVPLHRWDVSPTEAVAVQNSLAHRIDLTPSLFHVRLVAGADVSYDRFSDVIFAGVVVLQVADMVVVEKKALGVRPNSLTSPACCSFAKPLHF